MLIVNLNLQNRKVTIIGGGTEAQKRIKSLLNERCDITVITPTVGSQISRLAEKKKIKLVKKRVLDTKFISQIKPDLIIISTDDTAVNAKILAEAKKRKILVYSSDNPSQSDFANLAVIDIKGMVQIGIYTGGQSPAMAKKLKLEAEKRLEGLVSSEDAARIKIQKTARNLAKDIIPSQQDRKRYLHSVINDHTVDQLIKDGEIKKAEKRAIAMLRNWK